MNGNKIITIAFLSVFVSILIIMSQTEIDCFDIDYDLSANMVGEITLTDEELENLHVLMEWCLDNGYLPESISNFQIKIK